MNCKYYDAENGWCKKKSSWSSPMPEIVYCLGNCKDMVTTGSSKSKKKSTSKVSTQLFRAATVEDLKHTADIWYKAATPRIMHLDYKALDGYVELYLIYEEN